MNYDDWKQKAPPSDIDFEKMTVEEQREQEDYEHRLKIELAKKQLNHVLDIVREPHPYIYKLLKKIKL